MKVQRTLMAAVMLSACTLLGAAQAGECRSAPQMDALTAARMADISMFWNETETPAAFRVFAEIGATLGL